MRRLAGIAVAVTIAATALGAPRKTAKTSPSPALPVLGTRLSEFPAGEGKLFADKACLQCHGTDLPRQQRLTEKQWTSVVEKMMRWGAAVNPDDKNALIGYLSAQLGPNNDAFVPVDVM